MYEMFWVWIYRVNVMRGDLVWFGCYLIKVRCGAVRCGADSLFGVYRPS